MENKINRAINCLSQIFKKDFSTLEHSLDVYNLVKAFYYELPDNLKVKLDRENLLAAALLHDIGKLPIPAGILKKPCGLTDYEKEIVKSHAAYSKKMLVKTEFVHIADWVFYHHERVDGTGYFGLTKEQTPLESKIIAVADTYSALTLKRVYRNPCSVKRAINILKDVSGAQLDETLVGIFCGMTGKQKAFDRRYELNKQLIPLLLKAGFN